MTEAEYKEGLTLAQLMPGPLAAQSAIYLGYVHYSVVGATVIGIAFVRCKKIPEPLLVIAAAMIGLLVQPLVVGG
jgi:chromate transporter